MRSRLGWLALSVAIASPPLILGCAALHSSDTRAPVHVAHRSLPAQLAAAQMRSGDDARFELCEVDACPKVTRKTLASLAPANAFPPSVMPLPAPAGTASPALAESVPLSPPIRPTADATSAPPAIAVKTIVVTFASGSALLTAEAQRQLKEVMPEVQRSTAIEIRGRTDELGSAALNDVLARNRALAVRDYLRAQRLPEATTIRLSAKGACCYVAGNDTAEGRAANRRVEIEYRPTVQLAQGTPHARY